MKTREFDLENYDLFSIMYDIVNKDIKEVTKNLSHPYLKDKHEDVVRRNFYRSSIIPFEELPKKEQAEIVKVAKDQYKEKKAKSIADYKEMRTLCDKIFHDDNQYKKLVPELENLFYCQAYTALKDFKYRKLSSKSVANSRFQARAMQYSNISCD